MHPFKGAPIMTQLVKVAIKDGDGVESSNGGTQQTVPVIRHLYSFHSSGSEIKQLLGPTPFVAIDV
jgi:hypothetical protein